MDTIKYSFPDKLKMKFNISLLILFLITIIGFIYYICGNDLLNLGIPWIFFAGATAAIMIITSSKSTLILGKTKFKIKFMQPVEYNDIELVEIRRTSLFIFHQDFISFKIKNDKRHKYRLFTNMIDRNLLDLWVNTKELNDSPKNILSELDKRISFCKVMK